MPGLPFRKAPATSLVQDQDIMLADGDKATPDLTITVIGVADKNGVKHVTDVQVSKELCMKSRCLRQTIEASKDSDEITLGGELKRGAPNKNHQNEGENLEGLLVMLAHLHGLDEQRMDELGLYRVSVLGVWYAIAYSERDNIGSARDILKAWFTRWYETCMQSTELDINSARSLAFPCQLFDHAVAFARVTKWLTYNHIGHVSITQFSEHATILTFNVHLR